MTEQHKITKAATTIGTGTLLSRLLGFLRDMVIANFFGAGMAADAFFVAFRLPNLWRRLVGEGSMTISFIPVYTEYLSTRSEEESKELTHIAFTLAGALLAILTILGIVFAPLLVRIIAPGWVGKFPESFQLTVTLSQIIFPYIFFMGLFALAMGILNSHRHFFAPSFAPVFLNICMILSVLLFFFHLKPPVLTLAFGVLAGGLLQFLFQIPFLLKKGITFHFNFDVKHPAISTNRASHGSRPDRHGGLSTQRLYRYDLCILLAPRQRILSLLCGPAHGLSPRDFCSRHGNGCSPRFSGWSLGEGRKS